MAQSAYVNCPVVSQTASPKATHSKIYILWSLRQTSGAKACTLK